MRTRRSVHLFAVIGILSFTSCKEENKPAEGTSKAPTPAATTSAASAAASVGPEGGALSLAKDCGDKIVIETAWFPEPEYGGIYQLIGPSGTVDKEKGYYSGPLKGTDATLEIRIGGPFVGFQQPSARLYQDKSILLTQVNTDEAIQNSRDMPTVTVVAPMEKNPQILMWPADKYNFKTFADIGKSNAKILYFPASTYMEFLLRQGMVQKSQVDGSYTGSPDRFVTEGNLVQQGFATNEPYYYEHAEDPFGIKPWGGKKISFFLISEAGYDTYPQALAARPEVVREKRACLKKLVPLVQKAHVDYARSPAEINKALVDITTKLDKFWRLSEGGNAYAIKKMLELRILDNGADKTLGNIDDERLQKMIDTLKPIFEQTKKPIKDGLKPSDIATNEFIDPSIGL